MTAVKLVKNAQKYGGKYVATRSMRDKTVISSGDDIASVYEDAQAKGARDPFVVYVPKKDSIHIY